MDNIFSLDSSVSRFIDKFLQHKTILSQGTPLADQYESYCYTPISSYHHRWFIEICNFYKIPITMQRQAYIWDGKQLDISQLYDFHHQMHEIGHYLMCPLEYKHYIDYGLGAGGAYYIEACRDDVEEDILASIFGIYIEFLVGDNIGVTIGDVGADEVLTREYVNQCFRYYYDLGIIDTKGNLYNEKRIIFQETTAINI